MTLWQERLPRESGELEAGARGGLSRLAQRVAVALLPVLVVAAVVLGGFHLQVQALIAGGVAAALVVAVAAWPAVGRSRRGGRLG